MFNGNSLEYISIENRLDLFFKANSNFNDYNWYAGKTHPVLRMRKLLATYKYLLDFILPLQNLEGRVNLQRRSFVGWRAFKYYNLDDVIEEWSCFFFRSK